MSQYSHTMNTIPLNEIERKKSSIGSMPYEYIFLIVEFSGEKIIKVEIQERKKKINNKILAITDLSIIAFYSHFERFLVNTSVPSSCWAT